MGIISSEHLGVMVVAEQNNWGEQGMNEHRGDGSDVE